MKYFTLKLHHIVVRNISCVGSRQLCRYPRGHSKQATLLEQRRCTHSHAHATQRLVRGDSHDQVYRKNRVADMSGGPGAYLEPEAAAAQIASGRRADYDSDHDHGFGDAIDTKKPSASSSASAIGAAAAKAAEASSATPGAEDPAQAEMANGKTPAAPSDQVSADPKTGSPALAAMDVDTEGRIPGDNAESRAGLKRDTEGGGDIDVDDDIDANAGGGRDERMSDNGESQMRQQMEQARRQREAERDGEGGRGYPDGDRSGGMQGYADEYEKMRAASGYGGNDDDGYNCDGDNAGRGKPHEDSESKPRGAKSDKSSDDEEEVDWEDSAEEDMDAATAEAMEQARIGMARAAARDLRESRATRCVFLMCFFHVGACSTAEG